MTNSPSLPTYVSEPKIEYKCPFMEIYHKRAQFDGFAKDYFVVNFRRRGGLIAVRDGKVLLVRQYRLLVNECSWELPGGTIEDSEDLRDGLVRECVEETGIRPRELRALIVYYPGLDNVDNRTSIFYSEGVEIVRQFRDNPGEVNDIEWLPLADCIRMIFDGRILDAMTITGLLAYNFLVGSRYPAQYAT